MTDRYQLLAWPAAEALDAESAARRAAELAAEPEASAPLRELAAVLAAKHPECEVELSGRLAARFPLAQAGPLAATFVEECEARGLVAFDPQEGELFWPQGWAPEAECWLTRYQGSVSLEPDPDTIRRELKAMNVEDVPYLVLSRGPGRFLQAALFDEVGWVLERRLEGDEHPWVCTDPLKRREVAAAFIAFREGDEAWARKLSWEPGA